MSALISARFHTLPDGRRLHYAARPGEGAAAVFLHGFSDSWRSFGPLFNHLAPSLSLLAPDQRGHGESAPAAGYRVADFTDDAIAFIETAASGPVHLVGHSLGTIVAQRVAAARPDLVASLILIGAARHARGHRDLEAARDELAALAGAPSRDYVAAFQAGTVYGPLPPGLLDIFVEESLKLDPPAWHKVLDGLVGEAPPPDRDVGVPVLGLWGDRDAIFGRAAQAALARAIPDFTLIEYPGVGHAPHWEAPARVARDIEAFLAARTVPAREPQHA